MPKVSVIIPSYNHAKFVAEAIQSVLDQTYQDFEIVITDDGSSDHTVDVIKQFTDSRLKLFCFEHNRGAAIAANNCIRKSTGEYVAMLSSDDVFLPQKLAKQVAFLDGHDAVGAVFGYADIIDEAGNIFPDDSHFFKTIFVQPNRSRFEWLNYFFFNGNCLCHPTALIRRQCYEQVGDYCENYAQLPDFDFWIRLCAENEIYIIPENLIKFRIRDDNQNASASRADSQIRHSTELTRILKNYTSPKILVDFRKIFPEAQSADLTVDICDIAALALSKIDYPPYRYFALDLLFEYLSRESISQAKASNRSYSPADLMELTGKVDVFNIISLEDRHRELQQAQAELEQVRGERQQTQAELEQTQTKFHQAQSELQQSQIELHQTKGELEQTQTKLDQTWSELQQTSTKLPQTQSELQSVLAKLQQSEGELQQSQSELQQSKNELQQSQSELHRIQTESMYLQEVVQAMASSKFWQVRQAWFKLKDYLPFVDSDDTAYESIRDRTAVSSSSAANSIAQKVGYNLAFARRLRQKLTERKQRLGYIVRPSEIPLLFKKLVYFYKQEDTVEAIPTSSDASSPALNRSADVVDPYRAWLAVNQRTERSVKHLGDRLQRRSASLPKISIVMPVYSPPLAFLNTAIESVVNQAYGIWELCIADDRSPNPEVRQTLEAWAAKDERIRLAFRNENGNISRATNTAADLATGEFILFLDHDDELTLDALGEIALYIADHPDTDFLYSDDDKINVQGQRYAPQFKPDWSPELLMSYMYMSHVCVVRRSIFEQVGGLRVGFEGSQDYDFALRATEVCREVNHLPLVLYHWRAVEGSTARSAAAKPDSFVAAQRALQDALARRHLSGRTYQPKWALQAGCGIFQYDFPHRGPSVAIIIPTKNQLSLLQACVESIAKTTYENYQVVIIDNESDDPATLAYLNGIDHVVLNGIDHAVLRIANTAQGFNFAAINNQAAQLADADYLLFLNNDTEVIASDWLSQMMGFAQIPGVGAVGARLLFPNRTIQHAGIVHGLYNGLAGPAFKCRPEWDHGYLAYANVARDYLAVTAACLLTPKKLFQELNGFDEKNFAVAYNDVDYGYRVVEAGYRCVYCPTAELYHKEGASRGFKDNPQELANFKQRYRAKVDRYYSPHLSLENEYFQIQPRKFVTEQLKPIKTLVLTHNLNWEGAPQSQYELITQLKTLNIIEPIVHSPSDGPLKSKYESHGIKVHVREHPLKHVYDWPSYEKRLSDFTKWIESLAVELIYANTILTFYAIDAAHQLSIPSIWNIRESEPWQNHFQNFDYDIRARIASCFTFPYRVVFVANATRNTYRSLNTHHNFAVIHNGLNPKRLKKLSEGWSKATAREALDLRAKDVAILLVGTVCERKGQQDLLQALAHLETDLHQSIKVFIVGDRPSYYSDQLKRLAANLPDSLEGRVAIVPETPDIGKYYEAADLFVFTSRVESYPRVILEAMAYGLAIITTPVFGVCEQVTQGINAEFYNPGDINQLATLLTQFIADKESRKMYGNNSKVVLQTLGSFEEMLTSYHAIFQEAYLSSTASYAITTDDS